MKTLKFYGNSDDTFVCDGDIRMSIGCWGREGVFLIQSKTKIKSGGKPGRLMVCGKYSPRHTRTRCWMLGISPGGEGKPLPDWSIRFDNGHGFSPVLVVEAPDDVTVTAVDKD